MSNIRKSLKSRLKSISVNRQDRKIPAFIGDLVNGVTKVSGKTNYIYVTIAYNGQVIKVRNNRIPNKYKYPIWIGYEKDSHILQVIGEREGIYQDVDLPLVAEHSHTWGTSDNPTWIRTEQISQLVPALSDTALTISVGGGLYKIGNTVYTMPQTDYDMSSYVPVSGAEWVAVSKDKTGADVYTVGDNYAIRANLQTSNIPAVSDQNYFLFAVKMYIGQTEFIHTLNDSDIYDPRFIFGSGGINQDQLSALSFLLMGA